jgi:hypothetical protein
VPNSKDFSHLKPALANGQSVSLQYALRGEPVHSQGRTESAGDNIQSAALWSTAPYVDPKKAKQPGKKPCKGKKGTCQAFAIQDLGYCVFHARQLGLYDAWQAKKEVASSTSQD